MTIEVGGSNGSFQSKFYSGTLTLSSGESELILPTPPAGQKIKLNSLIASSGTAVSITIDVGGTSVISALTLSSGGTSSDGTFIIAEATGDVTTNSTSGFLSHILAGTDEVITITSAAPTVVNIKYSYEFGI